MTDVDLVLSSVVKAVDKVRAILIGHDDARFCLAWIDNGQHDTRDRPPRTVVYNP